MGLLDLPAPLFAAADAAMRSVLPAGVRLVVWATIASIVSMALYRWLSPQQRIARLKVEVAGARRALDAFDGEFRDATPLLSRMFKVSLQHVGAVLWPAIVASIPLLLLLIWMATAYGYVMPGGRTWAPLEIVPANLEARWSATPGGGSAPVIEVLNANGGVVGRQPLSAPVPVLHKRRWWNALIGNPAGYVSATAPYERIDIGLQPREYLPVGPQWLRGWEVPFFVVLVFSSLAIKIVFRVQ